MKTQLVELNDRATMRRRARANMTLMGYEKLNKKRIVDGKVTSLFAQKWRDCVYVPWRQLDKYRRAAAKRKAKKRGGAS